MKRSSWSKVSALLVFVGIVIFNVSLQSNVQDELLSFSYGDIEVLTTENNKCRTMLEGNTGVCKTSLTGIFYCITASYWETPNCVD
jgi:hypothetical protein